MFSNSYFDRGSGPVVFSNLQCNGNEPKLEECSSSSYDFNSNHSSDVGVKCLERSIVQYVAVILIIFVLDENDCIAGNIRLVNGSVPNEGRLEVCLDREWGTVCSSHWDKGKTSIVCKQLGYHETGNGNDNTV